MILQVVANVLLSSPPDRIFLGCKQKKTWSQNSEKNRLQSGWIFCGSAFLGDEDFQQMRRTTRHTNDCLLQNLQRKINFLNISFGGVGWTLSLSVYMLQKESSIQILSISKVQDNGEPTNVKMYISYIQTGDFLWPC